MRALSFFHDLKTWSLRDRSQVMKINYLKLYEVKFLLRESCSKFKFLEYKNSIEYVFSCLSLNILVAMCLYVVLFPAADKSF